MGIIINADVWKFRYIFICLNTSVELDSAQCYNGQ